MLDFVIFAITFLTVLLIAIVWLYPSSKKVTTIPGLDPSTKEDGNLSDIAKAGSLHEFLLDLHQQHGEISGFWMGQRYVVSLASPQLFKAHANVFDRPESLFAILEPLIGPSSLQYANGSDGRSRRMKYDKAFSPENLSQYVNSFQEMADVVARKWSARGESDHIPLMEDIWAFAIRTALRTLMGGDFKDDKLVQSVNNAFSKAWSEMEQQLTDPVVLDEKSSRQKSLKEAIQYLKSTIHKVISHRRGDKVQSQRLLIDVMLESTTDDDMLVSDIITYLVGGFHTTANLLTWAMYFMAAHPSVQRKVHKEIADELGENGLVSESNYGKLRYVQQVLDETLRCAVVVQWSARVQEFDTELGGHKVPKHTPVIQALGVVLQDEQLWPLPHTFDPDRFSDENSSDIPPFAFSPFGFAGKRLCPGRLYACMESTVFLVSLIRKFEVKLWSDQVVTPVFGMVTHPQDEIWVKVSKRK